jgi:uncharacterized membrane protein YqhA
MRTLQRWFESAFETFLFNSRLIVILAVVGSLASSVMMFIRGAIVIWHTAKDFFHHATDPHGGEELAIALISSVDSFLFATVLLIFAMGIYELFISKIDPASRTEESRPNWLQIHSLDDLKGAVGKVILMILIVRLFESAVKMKYDSPLHLLYLGLSVLFVAGSLFLQHAAHKHEPKHGGDDGHHDKHPKRDSGPVHAVVPHAPVVPHAAHVAQPAHGPGALPPDLAHAASMLAQHPPAQHQPPVAPGQPSYPHAQPPAPAQSPAQWGANVPDPNGQPPSTAFIQAPRRY